MNSNTPRNIRTLVEDRMHAALIANCKSVVVDLNTEFGTNFLLKPIIGYGRASVVKKLLPSQLALCNEKHLVVLDIDSMPEQDVFNWVSSELGASQTQSGQTIRITQTTHNVLNITLNNAQKIVTILPMGLSSEFKSIMCHSVEDYILFSLREANHIIIQERPSSKMTLEELRDSGKFNEDDLNGYMKFAVNRYTEPLKNYLRPLWKFRTN